VTDRSVFLSLDQSVDIDYTNHRGERGIRRIVPLGIEFGANEWHPEPQWLLRAFDADKKAVRLFAMKDIQSWSPHVHS
jgi:predicted DNA-binding transcriptional regulator YafY